MSARAVSIIKFGSCGQIISTAASEELPA